VHRIRDGSVPLAGSRRSAATPGNPAPESVRKAVANAEPNIALTELSTANEIIAENMNEYTVVRRMLLQMAVLGLLLAAMGIYGVVANLASERVKEVGIRMALGAMPGDVVWLFLRSGVRLALVGTAIGLVGAFALTKVLSSQISRIPGNDPLIVIGVALFLFAVAVVACWLPARRATRVSPTVALRTE
jgi:putative ABC transport system permease protein